ncbi:hypothetical protein FACS189487_06310 [Campylobacterota bacterium]|nr:hypothetical protein FACS189487_06310 [Campylobacterota bacterium]
MNKPFCVYLRYHTAKKRNFRLNSWLTVIALACAAFIFNTTEFVPIGLLTLISESFEMEPAHTGYLMTIYAWCVAILSLPLTILTAKIDRRKLLLALFVIFIASHIFCAFAWNFWTLLAARLGIAAAHSIFWAITIPLAVRVAPDHAKSKAIGALIAGSSLAAVLGVPGGSFIGKEFGWRVSFAVIGIVAALIAFLLFRILPKLPSKNAVSLVEYLVLIV